VNQDKSDDTEYKDTVPDAQEVPSTSEQLDSILDYIGPSKAGAVIKDASGSLDALKRFEESSDAFQWATV
jgi:hypothetical protein